MKNLLFTREEFVEYIRFIQEQDEKQLKFIDALEALAPGEYCNVFIYSEYQNKLLELIQRALNDENDDIGYKMYEFDQFSPREKESQLEETPWLESWETLYDYLANKE